MGAADAIRIMRRPNSRMLRVCFESADCILIVGGYKDGERHVCGTHIDPAGRPCRWDHPWLRRYRRSPRNAPRCSDEPGTAPDGRPSPAYTPRVHETALSTRRRAALKPLLQSRSPDFHGFRSILQFTLLLPLSTSKLEPPKFFWSAQSGPEAGIVDDWDIQTSIAAGWLCSYESLVAESRNQTSSENSSLEPSASRCSKHLAQTPVFGYFIRSSRMPAQTKVLSNVLER